MNRLALFATIAFSCSAMNSARCDETAALSKQAPDSSIAPDAVKSFTTEFPPGPSHKKFLDSLKWEDHPLKNGYTLRLGRIYDKWIAALEFVRNKQVTMTEYTPPAEYVTIVNPENGESLKRIEAIDTNHDGIPKIAFLHQKLNDSNYHMYAIYALNGDKPKLVWKSGGSIGNWWDRIDK